MEVGKSFSVALVLKWQGLAPDALYRAAAHSLVDYHLMDIDRLSRRFSMVLLCPDLVAIPEQLNPSEYALFKGELLYEPLRPKIVDPLVDHHRDKYGLQE